MSDLNSTAYDKNVNTSDKNYFQKSKSARRPFTSLDNKFLQIGGKELPDLSFRIICYLMSLPDDWKVYMSQLQKHFGVGRDKLISSVKALVDKGYMNRTPYRLPNGQVSGWVTEYSDIPEFINSHRPPEKPSDGTNRRRQKPNLQNKYINNKINKNNNSGHPQDKLDHEITKQSSSQNVVVKNPHKNDSYAKLEAEFGKERFERALKHLPANPKNKVGWLRKALEDGYQWDDSYQGHIASPERLKELQEHQARNELEEKQKNQELTERGNKETAEFFAIHGIPMPKSPAEQSQLRIKIMMGELVSNTRLEPKGVHLNCHTFKGGKYVNNVQ